MKTFMRSILTISLPEEKKQAIIKKAKKAGKSVSAYIISVIELESQLISEDELLAIVKKFKRDYYEGKTKILN